MPFSIQITYGHEHDTGQLCSTRLRGQDSQQQRTRTIIKPTQQKTQHPHKHQSSQVGYEIQTIQTHFLKLFLASDSTYLMYLVRHLVDMKSSFTVPLCDSSKCLFISCVKVRICLAKDRLGLTIYDVQKCGL